MNASHELLRIGLAAAAAFSHSDKPVVTQGQPCPDGTVPMTTPSVDPDFVACWDGNTRDLTIQGEDGAPVLVTVDDEYCQVPACLDEIATANVGDQTVVLLGGDAVTVKGRAPMRLHIGPEGNDAEITVARDTSFYLAPVAEAQVDEVDGAQPGIPKGFLAAFFIALGGGIAGLGLSSLWKAIRENMKKHASGMIRSPELDLYVEKYGKLRAAAVEELSRSRSRQLPAPSKPSQTPGTALAVPSTNARNDLQERVTRGATTQEIQALKRENSLLHHTVERLQDMVGELRAFGRYAGERARDAEQRLADERRKRLDPGFGEEKTSGKIIDGTLK